MLRNLPKEINARMLMMELFHDDGDVINAIVHSDERGLPLGTGEVMFAKRKEAHRAIVRHRGSIWRGKKIKMTMIGQMMNGAPAKIMTRRERRRKEVDRRRKSAKTDVHKAKKKRYDAVHEPVVGRDEDEEEANKTAVCVHEKEEELFYVEPDGDVPKPLTRNNMELETAEASIRVLPKSTHNPHQSQYEYIANDLEDENSANFHVTLKNLQQYTELNEMPDSEDEQFLGS